MMANDQINVPSLVVILVLSGLIVRYLFFSTPGAAGGAGTGTSAQQAREQAVQRQREAAVERIQQMFPQVDRRTILWDLQRNGGNLTGVSDRILAGRMERPPVTFQPPPPPTLPSNGGASGSQPAQAGSKQPTTPAQPDLIQRYKLHDKVGGEASTSEAAASSSSSSSTPASAAASAAAKGKAWSANKDERQSLLQKRRDEMILAARRKMEAKIAAEKAAAAAVAAGSSS